MKKIIRFLSIIILVVSMSFAVGCAFVYNPIIPGNNGNNNVYVPPTFNQKIDLPTKEEAEPSNRKELSAIDAVKVVEKSVVAIQVSTTESTSAGAGVLVDVAIDGETSGDYVYVITCHHVIAKEGASVIVSLPDENVSYNNDDYTFEGIIGGSKSNYQYAVALVGGDKTSDLAVLRINLNKPAISNKILSKSKITTAVLPPQDYSISKGEEVFAIGNPTGSLPGWYASGSISLVETIASVSDIGNMKLIGINVTTNHGNSGGGLFNMYGELIGITNAGNEEYTAINFAIPLYTSDAGKAGVIDSGVVNIVTNLLQSETTTNYGYVAGRRALFGITISNPEDDTVLVNSVTAGSLAEKAGFKANDVIVAFRLENGENRTNFKYSDLIYAMDNLQVGQTIYLTITRIKQTSSWQPPIQETHTFSLTATQYHFCNTGK